MIKIFKKFFRFSGEHRRAWYLSVVLEFLRCIAEAIQFFPLFLVLLHLVDGTMTPAVAWTALGLVALSVALPACTTSATSWRCARATSCWTTSASPSASA